MPCPPPQDPRQSKRPRAEPQAQTHQGLEDRSTSPLPPHPKLRKTTQSFFPLARRREHTTARGPGSPRAGDEKATGRGTRAHKQRGPIRASLTDDDVCFSQFTFQTEIPTALPQWSWETHRANAESWIVYMTIRMDSCRFEAGLIIETLQNSNAPSLRGRRLQEYLLCLIPSRERIKNPFDADWCAPVSR